MRLSIALSAALLLLLLGRALLTGQGLPRTAVDWPNLLTLLLLPVGLWASADLALSWSVAYKVVAGFVIFYGVAGLAESRWMRFLPLGLILLAAGLAAMAFLGTKWSTAKIPFIPASFYDLLPSLPVPWRPEGVHPNLVGGAIALLLPAVAAIAWWGKGRWLRVLALLTAGLAGIVLLLSQSRGAWIAAAIALLLMPWLRYRRWWLVVAGLILLVAAGLWWAGPGSIENLLFPAAGAQEATIEVTANTLSGRLELWSRALYLIQDFSLTGAGLGMFERVVLILYPPFFAGIQGGFTHAHNAFLQTAADFGLLGLIAHIALLLGLAASLIAVIRSAPADALNGLALGLLGSLLVYVTHGLVEAMVATPRGYLVIYLLFGAIAALSRQLRPPNKVTPDPRIP